jgi:hypothetical protein
MGLSEQGRVLAEGVSAHRLGNTLTSQAVENAGYPVHKRRNKSRRFFAV